ncbi:biotin/lipoyl-containing protein [Paenalcaligenes niemegkensis]|uniref:biotin/lipoyl-containing protein n=1 Tax=Paenalcaligenes niemegkensis TaxID=2895469 RepID=UPI003569E09D
MSVHVIKIPDVGEGIAEVELVEWLVKVGDFVHEDQNVASVMTDKVSVDISSPVAGTVERIGGNAGDILLVGADLISIQVDGPDTPEDTGFGSVTNESPAKLFAEVSQPEVDSLGVEALAVGGVQSEAETEEESTLKTLIFQQCRQRRRLTKACTMSC